MSRDDSFDSDDIYDFDYLNDKHNPWDQPRPKLRPKVVREERVKLPPVLVGRNIAAENNARMSSMMASRRTPAAVYTAQDDSDKDWHKERLKLKGPRQPQKEVYGDQYLDKRSTMCRNHAFEQTKLPDIVHRTVPKYKGILTEGLRASRQWAADNDPSLTPRNEPPVYREYGLSSTYDGKPLFPDPRPLQLRDGYTVLNVEGDYESLVNNETTEDKIKKAIAISQRAATLIQQDRGRPSVFDKNYLTPEEKAAAAKIDIDKELEKMAEVNVPRPPSAPRPVDTGGFTRGRRRVRYKENLEEIIPGTIHDELAKKFGLDKEPMPPPRDLPNRSRTPFPPLADSPLPPPAPRHRNVRFVENMELNQAVSIHNDPKPYYKPRPNTPQCVDLEREVNEGVAVQKKFEEFNRALMQSKAKGYKAEECESVLDAILESPDGVGVPFEIRPGTAAMLNRNDYGCSTPTMPNRPMEPQLRAEPMKPWDGKNAKRGVGFKSKIKKEEPKKIDINSRLPDKIRRQMERYFK